MSNPDILFKGIPRAPTRGYTAQVIQAIKPDQVIIPCTGSFSLAWVAREAGVHPSRMVCGDISLYSTALGHAIMDKDWRLEIREPGGDASPLFLELLQKVRPLMSDPVSKAAAVMFAIRVLQYDGKVLKQHKLDHQRELLYSFDVYIDQLRGQIGEIKDLLGGLTYCAQDMWVTLEEYKGNPAAIHLTNPPRYTGGYNRMFAGIDAVFAWDEPSASQFTEKDYARLMDMMGQEPALTLMYYATQGEDPAPLWGEPWQSVFADLPSKKGAAAAINWIIANRNPAGVQVSRAKINPRKPKFKLFDGEITADSQFRAMRIDKDTGDYYRDLLIHKLPGSVTEVYVALLIDGMLSGVIGLHLADLRRGKVVTKGERVLDHCASVTFAFTVPHETYKRLHKLTLMSIVSTWFWDDVLGAENWYAINGAPRNIKTVMLTQHPENKTARGILKLDDRVPQPDGSYKLHYSAPTIQRRAVDTFGEWFKKFGGVEK